MKTILAALIALSIAGGLSGQASAAASSSTSGRALFEVAAADYDSPAFGTPHWWELQEDRG